MVGNKSFVTGKIKKTCVVRLIGAKYYMNKKWL